MEDQISAVYNVLEELGIVSKPIITVFNKTDKVTDKNYIEEMKQKYYPSAAISALNKEGLKDLISLLDEQFLSS